MTGFGWISNRGSMKRLFIIVIVAEATTSVVIIVVIQIEMIGVVKIGLLK